MGRISLLLIFLMILNCSTYGNNSRNRNEKIKDWRLEDISATPLHLPEKRIKLWVFTFVNLENSLHRRFLEYSNLLLRKYSPSGLYIAGVVTKRPQNQFMVRDIKKNILPVIWDRNQELHKKFSISECCGGVVLLDSNENILFKESILVTKEDVRQLVEKNLLGVIRYEFPILVNPFFTLHRKSPSLLLTQLHSGKNCDLLSIKNNILVITIFSSFCNACHSGQRIQTLQLIEKKLREENSNHRLILLSPDRSTLEEIMKNLETLRGSADIYLCPDIFSDEEKYIQNPIYITDPLTIVLDENKRVIYREIPGTSENHLVKEIASLPGSN